MIKARIEAERVDRVGAFGRATGDADGMAAPQFGDLAHRGADRAGGGGDHKGFAGLWLANFAQTRPAGEAGHAKHAKRPGRVLRLGAKAGDARTV